MASNIHTLFPLPVMEFKIKCPPEYITRKCDMYKGKMHDHALIDGEGKSTWSPNDSILYEPEFGELKKEFIDCLSEYGKLLGLQEFVLTNSWLSIMNNGTSLKMHRHEASLISGAYYPKCPQGSVGLSFRNPLLPHKMCELHNNLTAYNAVESVLPANEGYLYLFPSWLEHGTKVNMTAERYVISFNTMHKGDY